MLPYINEHPFQEDIEIKIKLFVREWKFGTNPDITAILSITGDGDTSFNLYTDDCFCRSLAENMFAFCLDQIHQWIRLTVARRSPNLLSVGGW